MIIKHDKDWEAIADHQAVTIANLKAELARLSNPVDASNIVAINEEMTRVLGMILLLATPEDNTIAALFKRGAVVYQKARDAK
jgi:hypothetical protein